MTSASSMQHQPNVFDPAFYRGTAWPTYEWLRTEAPAYWNSYEHGGFWVLSRHVDACDVGRTPTVYSAAAGFLPRSPETDLINQMIAGSLLGTDPPEHREMRNMVRGLFKQSVANDLEPTVRRFVKELLDRIEPGEPFDLVTTVSAPLPFLIVGELLGIDEGERAELEQLVDAALAYEGGGAAAVTQAFEFFTQLVGQRRSAPGNDIVSAFCAGTPKKQMEDWEVIQSTFVVVMGASETVRALISQGLLVLRDHPESLTRMRQDPAVIPAAVDELLRYITPINYFCRTAAVTHELHGATINEGDVVMVLLAAANRDRAVFGDDADELVIDRDPNPHLAFGFGEHFCLGAPMGRLQGRIFFEEWLARFGDYNLVGEPQRSASTQINIIEHLPLVATSS